MRPKKKKNFKIKKNVTRNKEVLYIMIKGSIHEKDNNYKYIHT